MKDQNTIKCPTCGKQDTWNPNNVDRPYCSERCKMIDLGEWARETRTIPGESIELNLILENNENL